MADDVGEGIAPVDIDIDADIDVATIVAFPTTSPQDEATDELVERRSAGAAFAELAPCDNAWNGSTNSSR